MRYANRVCTGAQCGVPSAGRRLRFSQHSPLAFINRTIFAGINGYCEFHLPRGFLRCTIQFGSFIALTGATASTTSCRSGPSEDMRGLSSAWAPIATSPQDHEQRLNRPATQGGASGLLCRTSQFQLDAVGINDIELGELAKPLGNFRWYLLPR